MLQGITRVLLLRDLKQRVGLRMSTTTTPRATTKQVHDRTQELEGRVTGLERDMQHTLQMVEQTNRTVTSGFTETRRMFQEAEERATSRDSELHRRIDDQQRTVAQTGKVSWPLVISAIVAALAVGGVFVSFVNMSLSPVITDISEIRSELLLHESFTRRDAEWRGGVAEQLKDAHYEVEKLHRITDQCAADRREVWVEIGRMQERLNALERQQELQWPAVVEIMKLRGAFGGCSKCAADGAMLAE